MRPRVMMLVAAGALGALLGCQATDGTKRRVYAEEQFSIAALGDGWEEARERGALVFYGPASDGLDRSTIVIRSVPRHGDWVDERTPERVVHATEVTLGALPKVQLGAPTPLARDGLRGAAFELSFEPESGGGERYQRRHCVLVGPSRVFHVVHTAPAGELGLAASVFETVIGSIREEA